MLVVVVVVVVLVIVVVVVVIVVVAVVAAAAVVVVVVVFVVVVVVVVVVAVLLLPVLLIDMIMSLFMFVVFFLSMNLKTELPARACNAIALTLYIGQVITQYAKIWSLLCPLLISVQVRQRLLIIKEIDVKPFLHAAGYSCCVKHV